MLMCLSLFGKKTKELPIILKKEERSRLETTKNNSDLDWDMLQHKPDNTVTQVVLVIEILFFSVGHMQMDAADHRKGAGPAATCQ